MAGFMGFMGWINLVMSLIGACSLCLGIRALATGKLPRRLSEQYRDPVAGGRYLVGFGLFCLLQVVGYLGVEFGLFGSLVRGAIVVLAFVLAAVTVLLHRRRRDVTSRP
ncbi:hypothetical protein AMIS_38160 [Actinoplanes missouriensis 431]|uniref:Integral membrane protein n=2 Tax=Actinoplanes missouriensis TaxID=1866 RepID=I0H7P9_ACTM4|nr:hypothetical protein AMIS_38160 [Actinoplanes missouriensis 431]